MSRETSVLFSTVSYTFFTFSVVVEDENENRKTRYMWGAAVIWFLNAKNFLPAEIYKQIVEAYGECALNEGNARKWCRLFKEGRNNVQWRRKKRELVQLKWDIFEYRIHNFDLEPSEYHLFVLRKTLLAGLSLRSDQKTKDVLENWKIV